MKKAVLVAVVVCLVVCSLSVSAHPTGGLTDEKNTNLLAEEQTGIIKGIKDKVCKLCCRFKPEGKCCERCRPPPESTEPPKYKVRGNKICNLCCKFEPEGKCCKECGPPPEEPSREIAINQQNMCLICCERDPGGLCCLHCRLQPGQLANEMSTNQLAEEQIDNLCQWFCEINPHSSSCQACQQGQLANKMSTNQVAGEQKVDVCKLCCEINPTGLCCLYCKDNPQQVNRKDDLITSLMGLQDNK